MSGYTGFEASWHDLFWAAEEVADELDLLGEFLKTVTGESLYIGSGSGRLLGPLVAAGHRVTGLELSREMACLSKERYPDAGVMEGAWEDFDEERRFQAVVIPAFTFQLLAEPEKQLRRLRCQAERLYLTLFFPWMELSGELPARQWYFDRAVALPDGGRGILETKHQLREQGGRLVRHHRYTRKNASGAVIARQRTEQRLRFFTDTALANLLKRSGWQIEREIANLGEERDEGDPIDVITLFLRRS